MIITKTKLDGLLIIEPKRFEDERGFFARAWSEEEFSTLFGAVRFVEGNIAFNRKKNTLRGMHYQEAPHGQAKLVRCTSGAIYDVGIDLRPDSPTFKQWIGIELTAQNHLALFIPSGFAHGYQTLVDNSEVHYDISSSYAPESSRGVRWNDPAFRIEWPHAYERIMVARDREYPNFKL